MGACYYALTDGESAGRTCQHRIVVARTGQLVVKLFIKTIDSKGCETLPGRQSAREVVAHELQLIEAPQYAFPESWWLNESAFSL